MTMTWTLRFQKWHDVQTFRCKDRQSHRTVQASKTEIKTDARGRIEIHLRRPSSSDFFQDTPAPSPHGIWEDQHAHDHPQFWAIPFTPTIFNPDSPFRHAHFWHFRGHEDIMEDGNMKVQPTKLQGLSTRAIYIDSIDFCNYMDLPNSRQNMACGYYFNHCLDVMTLPDSLQRLDFWHITSTNF